MAKVLVVDSDSDVAASLRTELAAFDCSVQVVGSGEHGFTVARYDRPDVIILSEQLPDTTGFSICNKLKRDAELRDVPLVMMLSESNEETIEQHKQLRTHADDYVIRGVAVDELVKRIQALVTLEADAAATL